MKNKLGITEYYYGDVEKELINFKLNMLDNKYTFNSDMFKFEYLIKLHEFLFNDLYTDELNKVRTMTEIEVDLINELLDEIKVASNTQPSDNKKVLINLKTIWGMQPFIVGNTRTLFAYLKILNDKYMLDFCININGEIKSEPATFNLNNFVNQKTLTKNK